MKIRNLALLSALMLGLAPLASAQREGLGISFERGGVTVGAKLGRVDLRLGFGGRASRGYRSSSRYVSTVRCAPARVWVDGYYRTDHRRVWVPAGVEKRWVEPVYETRYDPCGRTYRVLVRSGCWTSVQVPGHYEERAVKTWIPGRWEYRR